MLDGIRHDPDGLAPVRRRLSGIARWMAETLETRDHTSAQRRSEAERETVTRRFSLPA